MPALVLFGRRWHIGSDDLVIPSFLDFIIRFTWLIASVIIFMRNESQFDLGCDNGSKLKIFIFGVIVTGHLSLVLDGALIFHSQRGTIMNDGPRKHVPLFMYFRFILEGVVIGWNVLGSHWYWNENFDCDDLALEAENFVNVLLIFNWALLLVQLFFVIYCFDTLGASKTLFTPSQVDKSNFSKVLGIDLPIPKTKYSNKWQRCCRFFGCCATGKEVEDVRESFREIARLFGASLVGDYVYSDVVAGFILLWLKNKEGFEAFESVEVIRRFGPNDGKTQVIKDQPLSTNYPGDSSPPLPPQRSLTLTYRSSPSEESHLLKEIAHFVKYACGSFGWPVVYFYRTDATCRLARKLFCCACIPSRTFHPEVDVEGDNCCLCWTAGLRDTSGLKRKDLVHVSFKNRVFEPAFYIAFDHKTKSIVLAIRGTLSVDDAVTDMSGWPVHLPGYPHDFKAHHGMVIACTRLRNKIARLGVLTKAAQLYPDYNLVVTGQSLGAGCAAILSMLLRSQYPKLRCFAFSPPGGLMSMEAADYCNEFTISVVYGDDLVSRLGVLQIERLKLRLIAALHECNIPKYRVLLGPFTICCSKNKGDSTSRPDSRISENTITTIENDLDDGLSEVSTVKNSNFTTSEDPITDCPSPTSISNKSFAQSTTSTSTQALPDTNFPTHQGAYPPGRIIYVRELPEEFKCPDDPRWTYRWASRTEFDEIVVSPRMILDHTPFRMPKALQYLSNVSYYHPSSSGTGS